MKRGTSLILLGMATSLIAAACGPSQAEMDATATQFAANIFATQTAQAPTATLTPTLTPTITPTPPPPLLALVLTRNDLPDGFEELPAADLSDLQSTLSEDSVAFGFTNERAGQLIMGFLLPYPTRLEQEAFDAALPQLLDAVAAAMGAPANRRKLSSQPQVGEASETLTWVQPAGVLVFRWEVLASRRGEVGQILLLGYMDGDEPPVSIIDLASVLDERLTDFVATTQ